MTALSITSDMIAQEIVCVAHRYGNHDHDPRPLSP